MTELEQRKIFAKNLNRVLDLSGHTRKEIADVLGFNYKTFNGWCNGISMPSMGKVQKIADYFHIGKSDLLDDHHDELSQNQDTTSDKVEWYTDPETAKLAQELHDNPDLRILLDAGRDLPPEKLRALIALITPHIGEDG